MKMLSVIVLDVSMKSIMLHVIMLNVTLLNVVAPTRNETPNSFEEGGKNSKSSSVSIIKTFHPLEKNNYNL